MVATPIKRPEHIKREWFKLLARFQGMSNQHPRAAAVYKCTILVDSNGIPQLFTRPNVIVLEPGRVDALEQLRETLTSSLNGDAVDDEVKERIGEVLELMTS